MEEEIDVYENEFCSLCLEVLPPSTYPYIEHYSSCLVVPQKIIDANMIDQWSEIVEHLGHIYDNVNESILSRSF